MTAPFDIPFSAARPGTITRLAPVLLVLSSIVPLAAAPGYADDTPRTTDDTPPTRDDTPRTIRGKDKDGWTHLVFVKPLSHSVGFDRLGWYRGEDKEVSIGGKLFDMAFVAHATSSIKFKLSGKCTELRACYGLKTGAGGAAVFVVLADDKEILRTGEIYGYGPTHNLGTKTPVTLDVTGVEVLELKAIGVRGGAGAWSCWGDPKVK
jgi:hypothetical protein